MIIHRLILDKQTGVCILVGDGVPTGFNAPAGSLFVRRDGGEGTSIYVKVPTGWTPLATAVGGIDWTAITGVPVGIISQSSQVVHSSTTGYSANQHVDHTAVSIDTGDGLAGGGTIAATRTLYLNTGSVHFLDGVKKKLNLDGVFSSSLQFNTSSVHFTQGVKQKMNTDGVFSSSVQINHNATTNYSSDQHVAHSGVTLTAGDGLSGGGTIAASRTFTLNTSSLHFISGTVRSLPLGTVSSSAQQVVTSYTNATDNRVLTSAGAGVINGEANFTFDGTTMLLTGTGTFVSNSRFLSDLELRTSTPQGTVRAISWHDAILITTGMRYTGSTDPSTPGNWEYLRDGGVNNIAGTAIVVKSNGTETGTYWSYLTAPTSTGAGTAVASLTERARLDGTGKFALNGLIAVGGGSAAAPSMTRTTDLDTGFFFPAANTLGVAVGGAELAQLSSGRLDLSGSMIMGINGSTSHQFQNIRNAGGEFYVGRESSVAGAFFTGASAYASVIYSNTNNIQLIRSGVRRLEVTTTGTTTTGSVLISGSIGIGTSSPGSEVDVFKPVGTSATIRARGSGSAGGMLMQMDGSGNAYLWQTENKPMYIGTNSIARIMIASGGFVGIGAITNPSSLLHLRGYVPAIRFEGEGYTGDTWELTTAAVGSNDTLAFKNVTDGTYPVVINGVGHMGVGVTSPTANIHVSGSGIVTGPITAYDFILS